MLPTVHRTWSPKGQTPVLRHRTRSHKKVTHCGMPDEPPRAPPQDASPALGELQYVSDLEFVDDAAPPEPVWSAD
jgi:hypothetical protein